MTHDEAQTIADIAVTVDGGCCVCVGWLLGRLQFAFPEHDWAELAPATYLYGKDEWRSRVPSVVADLQYEADSG